MPDIFRVVGPDGPWVRQSFGLQETIGDKRTLSSQLRIPGEFIALLIYVRERETLKPPLFSFSIDGRLRLWT